MATLQNHIDVYTGKPWEADNGDLTTYCEDCHWLDHNKKYLSINEQRMVHFILIRNGVWSIHRNEYSIQTIKELVLLVKSFLNG